MKVRILHGAYAGSVQEMPYHVATNLLQSGSAELVNDEPVREDEQSEAAVVAQPETAMRAAPKPLTKGKKNGR